LALVPYTLPAQISVAGIEAGWFEALKGHAGPFKERRGAVQPSDVKDHP
jgi:hypothetical protein